MPKLDGGFGLTRVLPGQGCGVYSHFLNPDGFVKSQKNRFSVIPAEAGIQYNQQVKILLDPVPPQAGFTGVTASYNFVNPGEAPQTDAQSMPMTLIRNLENMTAPLRNPVLTIGNFDGVHRGHLALFDKVKARARAIDGESVVLTFDPHPLKVTSPRKAPPVITPTPQKLKLIEASGIDVLVCIPFTRAFSTISARDFVKGYLVGRIGVREIVVGYDYFFGHRREGNIELLREMGIQYGFTVHALDQIRIDDTAVSSTAIRQRVQSGDIAAARELLGRDYQICGTVVSGMNRGGRLLGFPTANLEPMDVLTPKGGVYAVRVLIDDRCFDGLTNIGYNPTFDDRRLSVETHILDFSENLLGKTIQINFIQRLRDEETFDSVESLAKQIGRDVDFARDLFGKIGPCRDRGVEQTGPVDMHVPKTA